MKLKNKLLALSSLTLVLTFLFGSVVLAAPPSSPFQELWDTIFGIQNDVENLQNQIDEHVFEKGNISISAAQFTPAIPSDGTRNTGNTLTYLGPSTRMKHWAGVQLPDGATLTKVRVDWYDSGPNRNDLGLYRMEEIDDEYLCLISSVGDSGEYHDSGLVISERAIVDNSQFAYYLLIDLPASNYPIQYVFYRVFIEYEITS
jgi:hypothetical protein